MGDFILLSLQFIALLMIWLLAFLFVVALVLGFRDYVRREKKRSRSESGDYYP